MSTWIQFRIWQPAGDRLLLDTEQGTNLVDPEGASAYALEIDGELSLCIEGEDLVPIVGFDSVEGEGLLAEEGHAGVDHVRVEELAAVLADLLQSRLHAESRAVGPV